MPGPAGTDYCNECHVDSKHTFAWFLSSSLNLLTVRVEHPSPERLARGPLVRDTLPTSPYRGTPRLRRQDIPSNHNRQSSENSHSTRRQKCHHHHHHHHCSRATSLHYLLPPAHPFHPPLPAPRVQRPSLERRRRPIQRDCPRRLRRPCLLQQSRRLRIRRRPDQPRLALLPRSRPPYSGTPSRPAQRPP